MGWQWHQLDHTQIICTLLQTDNHASTTSLNFLQAECSSWCPTNSVKALTATNNGNNVYSVHTKWQQLLLRSGRRLDVGQSVASRWFQWTWSTASHRRRIRHVGMRSPGERWRSFQCRELPRYTCIWVPLQQHNLPQQVHASGHHRDGTKGVVSLVVSWWITKSMRCCEWFHLVWTQCSEMPWVLEHWWPTECATSLENICYYCSKGLTQHRFDPLYPYVIYITTTTTTTILQHPESRTGGFCLSKVLLPTCPCWW